MNKNLLGNTLLTGVIFLFVGASFVIAVNSNVETANMIDEIGNLNRGTEIFYPTDDCYISMRIPDLNTGTETRINIRNRYGAEPIWELNGLIKFDISDIPSDAIVKSAILNLYYYKYESTNPRGRTLTLYRVLEDWDEDTVTWNTRPDYATEVTSSAVVPSSLGTWMDWDVTEDVQDFVSGSKEDYGWQLMDENYWGGHDIPATNFRTKEYQDSNTHPHLEVDAVVLNKAILIGRITDVDTSSEDFITFKAEFLRFIQLSPFQFNRYSLGEEINVDKSYMGLLTLRFAFGIFNAGL